LQTSTLAHFATATGTVFLVVVGVWAVYETRRSLELSQRAWVSPAGAQLTTQTLEKNTPLRFDVSFVNSGREPAIDLNFKTLNSTIDAYDPLTTDMRTIAVPENTSCEALMPAKGRAVFAPLQTSAYHYQFDSLNGEPPLNVDDNILDDKKFYVVRGCVAYVTFQVVHHSVFCYILTPFLVNNGQSKVRLFESCPHGFEIN
jgi:hypothetical protein